MDDQELTDTELAQEALALSVRQRSIIGLIERRAAKREMKVASAHAARERDRKGASPLREDAPQYNPAA